jgi:putative FmdB family regulatory protein
MPTYEYRCKSCNGQFEAWQKMSDDPLTTCPTCGGPVRRLLFPAGIVFKGGGFYSTDQRANGSSGDEGAAATKVESDSAKPAADGKPAAESKSTPESKPTADAKPAKDSKTTATA